MDDFVDCPHCKQRFLPKTVFYSYPAQTICTLCGCQFQIDPRIKILTAEEAKKKHPELVE